MIELKNMQLINYIEENASNILKKEYNNQTAFIALDSVEYTLIDQNSLFYTVVLSYGFTDSQTVYSFEIPSVAGLAENFWDFTESEAFAFAVYVANLALRLLDTNTTKKENSDDFEDLIEDNLDNKYIC